MFDLPGRPLPPAATKLPPRLLSHWDQALLAYADRDRIIPPEIQPLKLTLSGDTTLTVDGRVVASWTMDGPSLRSRRMSTSPARASKRRRCGPPASARPRHAPRGRVGAVDHLRGARDEMDRRYAEPLDVKGLAHTALTSQAHFIREFKKEFGETPHRYLQRRRIEHAADLLAKPTSP